ncbi:Glycine betaine transport system permease protein OpuAB [Actinomadura rubteroloni]|uniref:Glycine betaine transport system permease protein OpuAB n=1 Tax=Actinomadura rubteroloni TaxID=1926885 RepID=A0A2P4UNF8_9ACTN|nr:proline/glycine betaine ABC transporter permease [Actinomadura rubteroloni]POM26590.1 Glycine betaine transport system permease protein OpuAB [Actinomadura rubteroloni]
MFFDGFATVVTDLVDGLGGVLAFFPPLVLTALLAALAYAARGWRLALFTFAGFALIDGMRLWRPAMDSLSLVAVSAVVALAVAVPIGLVVARYAAAKRVVRPVLDGVPSVPVFVYLVPAAFLFSIGTTPGVVATAVFALPAAVRLVESGLRDRPDPEEANRIVVPALGMVVTAGLVGAGGLGGVVLTGLDRVSAATGFEGAVAIVVLAVFLDRVTRVPARPVEARPVGNDDLHGERAA